MKRLLSVFSIALSLGFLNDAFVIAQQEAHNSPDRVIQFPDIPGYHTLKCDLHMHTVLSDGYVWPNIRVQEALKDGLDAISITDHIEYQPHMKDIPHPDRNRSHELASKAASGSDLIVINGAEITREMPPGHANAIFLEDVNKLNQDDVMEVFREAKRQGAFVFWNHPNWTAQRSDGVATITEMHVNLIKEGLIDGIEIVNENTYSDEALQIAIDHNLAILGTSDIHGLIDWHFHVPEGGHRPVTLVFSRNKSKEAMKEGLQKGRTAVWFDNTLVGSSEFLVPLIENSLVVARDEKALVQTLRIENISDAEFILENLSGFTLHDHASVVTLKPHHTNMIQVKTLKPLSEFEIRFRVLNAFTAPGEHPEIRFQID